MNVFAFLLALSALQGVLAAYPESLPESGEPIREEKAASARGGKPLRGDAEETQRGLGGGWGGSKDTDSPTMFPTLAPTISPTLSPTLFPTVSPTFCGKAGKASGDYYYSGKSSKGSGSRMAGPESAGRDRSARDRARARKEVRERERQAAYDRAMSMWVAEGSNGTPPALRNSKSSKSGSGSGSKSGKGDYYYSSGDDCTQGSRGGSKSSKSSKSGSRRALRAQEEVASDLSERDAPSQKWEPDSVRRRRVNAAS